LEPLPLVSFGFFRYDLPQVNPRTNRLRNRAISNFAFPGKLYAILAAAAFFWQIGTTVSPAQESRELTDGKFVATIPEVGSLTLELEREYQGRRSATMLWLFEEMRGEWSFEKGGIVFRRQPSYSQQSDEEPAFVLRAQTDGSWVFDESGLIDKSRAQFFAQYPWKSANAKTINERGGEDATAFYRAREQPKRFNKRGSLLPLPGSFPVEFMDLSALLFRDRERSIFAILKCPELSREVLEIVGDALLKGNAGEGAAFVLPVLGAHPNLSPRLQEQLFAVPKDPAVWRAVACNPSAAKTFYSEYLKRIREGDSNVRFLVVRDRDAPRAAWELAIAPKEPEVLQEFSRNSSAPADLLTTISAETILSDPVGLASNPATPVEILNRLSKAQPDVYAGLSENERKRKRSILQSKQLSSNDKQVLWSISRNPSAPAEAVERALRTLATCTSADLRDTAAGDPRLPLDLIERLSKDPSIQVRIILSMNKSVPLPILENLARDPYQMVGERARDNMKDRFPDAYAANEKDWVPLKNLNPNNSLIQDFEQAVKAGDVAKARVLLAFTDDPSLKPSPSTVVSVILANDIDPFKALLKESITEEGSGALETMIVNPNLTPDEVHWLAKEHLLDQKMTDRLALFATEKGRTDLLAEAKNVGLLKSLTGQVKNAALFTATAVRNDKLVDFWIAGGGNPDVPVREGLSSAGLAAKLGLTDLLRRMDVNGTHAHKLAETQKEFPPSPHSEVLGIWANKRNDSATCALTLAGDGTGMLGTAASSFPVVWRTDEAAQITVVLVGQEGPMREKVIQLQHDKDRDILISDQSKKPDFVLESGDPAPFYRIKNP